MARRLWRWFGVDSREELIHSGATLVNIAWYKGKKGKGDGYELNEHLVTFVQITSCKYDLTFLVGKVAQEAVIGYREPKMLWRFGRYAGLPHPSGINAQLNDGGDEKVRRAVRRWLRSLEL